jgi:predicted GNAT family acetyltransferase
VGAAVRLSAHTSTDGAAWSARIEPLLASRPAEHHVLATLRLFLARSEEATLAWVEDEDGEVVGAAGRTPPHPLVVSAMPAEAAGPLARTVRATGASLSGVAGPEPTAGRIAAAWAAATGARSELAMAQRVQVLAAPPSPATGPPGCPRPASEEDRALLERWAVGFWADTGVPADDPAVWVGLALGGGRLLLWEDGEPACMVGWTARALGLVRIAPVYTPPERRGRGYATALVAAACRRIAAGDTGHITLNSDRDDPVAAAVYRRVGFRPVAAAGLYRVA